MPKPTSILKATKTKVSSTQELDSPSPTQTSPVVPDSPGSSYSTPSTTQASRESRPQHGRTAAPSSKFGSSLRTGPYKESPASSVASVSHGNLFDTRSMTNGSVQDEAVSETSLAYPQTGVEAPRERRPSRHAMFQNMLSRTRSTKQDLTGPSLPPKLKTSNKDRIINSRSREAREVAIPESPQTAPLSPDRGFQEAMQSSTIRNRSADRSSNGSSDQRSRNSGGPSRFASFMTSSSKAASGFGRAGKGLMVKFTRGTGDIDQDSVPEEFRLHVINLPLVQQVRKTRLQSRLQDAKDKTEFWLPALPYRCIDFLNSKGVEQEGLYRVPGSVKDIKAWQLRFDKELDINLLDEPDFDDIYTVGSMLKAWFRELPDEIFPKATQARIARECEAYAGGDIAPPMLKEELSKLPPFNYYLLFAITAHITLLSKFSDTNKMTYQNLCICFQPCTGIDAFAFHFLVKDWRNCWQGCTTEKSYTEEEHTFITSSAAPTFASNQDQDSRGTTSVGNSGSTRPATGRLGSVPSSKGFAASREQVYMGSGSNGSTMSLHQGKYEPDYRPVSSPAPEIGPVTPSSPIKM